jgi:NAD(P)-dependent dehydrogenase (short-subunit alcohol dehydrogenase family)
MGPYKETKDGHENHFGVDHLGHFLFTVSILPRIRAARSPSYSPRILTVSSPAHRSGGVRFDDPSFDHGKGFKTMPAYAQAKTANILFTKELAKRLNGEGILVYNVDPGCKSQSQFDMVIPVVWTNFARTIPKEPLIAIGDWNAFIAAHGHSPASIQGP